jgi:hypothetical protein
MYLGIIFFSTWDVLNFWCFWFILGDWPMNKAYPKKNCEHLMHTLKNNNNHKRPCAKRWLLLIGQPWWLAPSDNILIPFILHYPFFHVYGWGWGIVKFKCSICENNYTTPIAHEHGKALPIVLFYEKIISYLLSLRGF